MPDWVLVGTSHFILLPVIAYLNSREWVCAGLVFGTYLSSIVHHSTKPFSTVILYTDMAFAQIANLCAVYTTLTWVPYSIPLYLCFLSCPLTIHYYGHRHNILGWDPDPTVSTWWHAFLHAFTSLASTLSILLAFTQKSRLLHAELGASRI